MISSGTSRNAGSKPPLTPTGYSPRWIDLVEQRRRRAAPRSRSRVSRRASSARTRSRRASGSTTTCAARSASTYSSGARDLDPARATGSDGRGSCGRRSGPPTRAARPRRRTARRATAPGARTRSRSSPSASTSATGSPPRARASSSGSSSRVVAARRRGACATTYWPFLPGDFLLLRAPPASTPFFAAKPCPALVGVPSARERRRHRRTDDLLVEVRLAIGEAA